MEESARLPLRDHDPSVRLGRLWRVLPDPRISDSVIVWIVWQFEVRDLWHIEDVRRLSGWNWADQQNTLWLDRFQRDLLVSPVAPRHVVAGIYSERLTSRTAIRRERDRAIALVDSN